MVNSVINMKVLVRHLLVAVGLMFSLFTVTVSGAAELIMFYSSVCEWCEAWNREVGIVYSKTAEGRTAPLRRIEIDEPRAAALSAIDVVIYTPTFVLMEHGREVGRILGYSGENHFWGLLEPLVDRLPLTETGTTGGFSHQDVTKTTAKGVEK